MSITLLLKNNIRNIPPNLGVFINRLPFSYRPGLASVYKRRIKEMHKVDRLSIVDKQQFVFEKVKNLVDYSYDRIPFYKEYYNKLSYNPKELKTFKDIVDIPIINKGILNEYDIEQRSSKRSGRYKVNTGGSTGKPFSFYIEPSSVGHEWAHMHTIWSQLDYKPHSLKLVFGGRSDVVNAIDYDVVRNSFNLDIYEDYKVLSIRLQEILKKYSIKYLHGYPSSIYNFALYCNNEDQELLMVLRQHLVGAFFGSEYPHKKYRDVIEDVFNIKTVSWYGHTERAVLAYEKKEPFIYHPFLTYGYTEAINQPNDTISLISTSYYNFASPLIRYDTEDLIEDPVINDGILSKFKITKGRSGEFVIDKNNKKINLTGLIFGRHHALFDHCSFVQVKQKAKGEIQIYYVSNTLTPEEAILLFDADNALFTFEFIRLDEPYRTASGKINLLIK